MQYALLIYSKPGAAEALSADEREANHREYLDIKKLPGVVGGASLHPVETATTVRVQDIGETSRPVTAQHANPASRYPRRCAQIATARPARPTAVTATSHQTRGGSPVPASRATAPDSDWSDGLAGSPIRF